MFLPFALVAGIGALAFAIIASRRKTNTAWVEAARKLGIELTPATGLAALSGKLAMRGTVEGLTVWINTFQSNDKTHTRYRVKMPSLELGLKMSR